MSFGYLASGYDLNWKNHKNRDPEKSTACRNPVKTLLSENEQNHNLTTLLRSNFRKKNKTVKLATTCEKSKVIQAENYRVWESDYEPWEFFLLLTLLGVKSFRIFSFSSKSIFLFEIWAEISFQKSIVDW